MKGIVSFALLLAFAAAMAHVSAARLAAQGHSQAADGAVLALEKRYYSDLDVKGAFRQALASAAGPSGKERITTAALSLASLEMFAEAEFARRGIQLDVWMGDAPPGTVSALRTEMLAGRRALKPPGALDLSAFTVDWEGKPVPLAAALLCHDPASGKVYVSRNTALVPAQPFSGPVFGASIYFDGVAAVALMGDGFHA